MTNSNTTSWLEEFYQDCFEESEAENAILQAKIVCLEKEKDLIQLKLDNSERDNEEFKRTIRSQSDKTAKLEKRLTQKNRFFA